MPHFDHFFSSNSSCGDRFDGLNVNRPQHHGVLIMRRRFEIDDLVQLAKDLERAV